jgi:hypothetical protein
MTHSGPSNVAWLLTLLLSGCCFDALSPPPTVAPIPPPSSPGTGTGPLLPGGAQGGIGTPIAFGVGSTDPMFAQGFGGGPIQGTTMDPSCYAGHYGTSPSHVLTITEPIPYFRVMAYSARGTDLTLLVRQPNGVVFCNDDSDGLNPMIEVTAPTVGEYQVYVGNFSAPGPEPYELGVSANNTVTPSSMHFAPTTTVTAAAPGSAIGTLLLTGAANVLSISGSLAGVGVGTACTYTQTRVLGTGGPGIVDCRWQVTCGTTDLYGGTVPGGYQPCTDPSWSPSTLAMDSATTATDTDPTFLFSGTTITIGDDSTGMHGAFTATLSTSTTPTAFVPIGPQAGS